MIGKTIGIVVATLLFSSQAVWAAADPQALVAHVDALRLPSEPNVRLDLHLTDWNGTQQKQYNYTAFIRADSGSLVLALDGDQRGQKYLSANGNYWLYAPNTHRAIRLTPLQAVRGQASVGDISRLHFADDYDATFAAPQAATVEGRLCWVLTLRAKSSSATYATIALYIAQADGSPVTANLMAVSGRKLKTLQFGPTAISEGKPTIPSVTYVDAVDTTKRTTVDLHSVESAHTSASAFQPDALPMNVE